MCYRQRPWLGLSVGKGPLEVWKREAACSELLYEMIPCCVLNIAALGDAGHAGIAGDAGKGSQ